ncbi:MAG: hypothetical protein WCI20_03290 [bacterium]
MKYIGVLLSPALSPLEFYSFYPDKTAWQCWLKGHVHYSADTAQNYMRVARFVGKNRSASVFLGLDPTILYRLAALPDEKAATLTPDTLLTDPRTGRQTALSQMRTRSLDRALDALEGKTVPQNPKPVSVGVALAGETREDAAADAQRIMGLLADQLADIRKRKGSLEARFSKHTINLPLLHQESIQGDRTSVAQLAHQSG